MMRVLTVQAPLKMQNHCCAPSLYIKVLEVDGHGRLLFFARHDIAMGQVRRRPTAASVCCSLLVCLVLQRGASRQLPLTCTRRWSLMKAGA